MWKPNPPNQHPLPTSEPQRVPPIRSGSMMANNEQVHSHGRTLIGKSVMIKGHVSGSEPIQVDGRIEGTISLQDERVVIGRSATIIAEIAAGEVTVNGEVKGKIVAQDRVELRSQATVLGDVLAKRISIEEGAVIKGIIDLCAKNDKRDGASQSDPVAQPVADPSEVFDHPLLATVSGAD